MTPEIIIREPLTVLKTRRRPPDEQNFQLSCRPIVNAAGRTPADIAVFLEKKTPPGGRLLFVTEA